jgi:ribosomal protein S18 acetylase RimI-like enzyme
MEHPDYYMEEGCGIYALAVASKYPNAEIYIISRNHGEEWSRSIPYEITHVFCRVPGEGDFDVRGKRTPDQMAADFDTANDYSIKGPWSPQEFYAKFMGNSDNKPLFGTKKDIKEVMTKIAAAPSWIPTFKQLLNEYGGDITKDDKASYDYYVPILSKLKFPLTIYRQIYVNSLDDIKLRGKGKKPGLGRFWADKESLACSHNADEDSGDIEVLLRAVVQPTDIDWLDTFYARIVYGEDEAEISIAPGTPLNVTGMRVNKSKWQVPPPGVKTAASTPVPPDKLSVEIVRVGDVCNVNDYNGYACISKKASGVKVRAYHGTTKNFDVFDTPAMFHVRRKYCEDLIAGQPDGHVVEAILTFKNPADLDTLHMSPSDPKFKEMAKSLEEQGYDGAQYKKEAWIAFYPEQIEIVRPKVAAEVAVQEPEISTPEEDDYAIERQTYGLPKDWKPAKPPEVKRDEPATETQVPKSAPPPVEHKQKVPRQRKQKMPTYTPPTENKAFLRWFGKSKVVGSNGQPLVVYHGTTHDFDVFNTEYGNPENHYGVGFYFTSSRDDTKNYAGVGPDLTSRIDHEAENLVNEWRRWRHGEIDYGVEPPDWVIGGWAEMSDDEKREAFQDMDWSAQLAIAKAEVKKKLVGEHGGAVMPCYLRIVKPVIVAPHGGTYFTLGYTRDGDYKGKLFDAVVRTLTYQFWGDTFGEDAHDGLNAYDFEQKLRKSEAMMDEDIMNEGGPGPVITEIYKNMGFDGIIMENPAQEFRNMGIESGTKHYIVWNPSQIKSALGNVGKFNKKNPSIVASGEEDFHEYIGNCTDDAVVESVFGDATLFAQALEKATPIDDTTMQSDEYGVLIKYDPETDIHSFYKTAAKRIKTVEEIEHLTEDEKELCKKTRPASDKTAMPNYDYSHYTDRETAIKTLNFEYQKYGANVVFSAENPADDRYQPGYLEANIVDDYIVVSDVFIGTSWTGTGLGQMLYDYAISESKKMGLSYFVSYPIQSMSADGKKAWGRIARRYTVTTVPTDTVHVPSEAKGTAYSTDDSVEGRFQIDLKTVLPKTAAVSPEVSQWFRKMVELKKQFHEDSMLPLREAEAQALRELGATASPEAVAQRIHELIGGRGDIQDRMYDNPPEINNEYEVQQFGKPLSELQRDAEFEDWARKKGIEIPEFPKTAAKKNKPTAVVIMGDSNLIEDNKRAESFYEELGAFLEKLGFEVSFDEGEPYTEPEPADLWIGHSRGADRLRFAPKGTAVIGINVPQSDEEVDYPIINNPDDAMSKRKFDHGKLVRSSWTDAHYTLTDEMKEELVKVISEDGLIKTAKSRYVGPYAFYIEIPSAARDHFWNEPPEHNMEFWAFRNTPRVLKGERIIFTMDKKPVAEAVCAYVEKPGQSKCELTGKYEKHWKVYWEPKNFKKYKTKTAAEPESVPWQTVWKHIEKNNPHEGPRDAFLGIPITGKGATWVKETIQPDDPRIDRNETSAYSLYPASKRDVKKYMKMYQQGSPFPRIVLGVRSNNKFVIYDGAHRLQAAVNLGVPIDAYVGYPEENALTQRQSSLRNPLLAKKLPSLNELKRKFVWKPNPSYFELEGGFDSWYLLPDGSYLSSRFKDSGHHMHHGQLAAYALGMNPEDFDDAYIKEDTWDNIREFSRKFKAIRINVTGDSVNVDALFPPTPAQMRELARLSAGNKKVYWADDSPITSEWLGKGTFPDFQRWLDSRFAPSTKTAAEYENAYQQDRNEYAGEWKETETEDESRTRYRRKNEWEQSLLAALSLGKMNPDDADTRKYLATSIGSRFADAFKPLPQVLYHVTTAKSKVQNGGLQSRFELSMQNGLGLGGGDNKSISFTEDLDIAKGIYSAMIEAKRVAAGEFTVQQMMDIAAKGEGADRPWITEFVRWAGAYRSHNEWSPGQPLPEDMQAILEGKKVQSVGFVAPMSESKLKETGYEPIGEGWQGRDEHFWSAFKRPMTPKEKQDVEFDQYKVFCYARENAGGALNPLFFSTDVEGLAKVPEAEIAILKFKPVLGAMGTQESALGEWRTYSGQAVQLVGDVSKTASVYDTYTPDDEDDHPLFDKLISLKPAFVECVQKLYNKWRPTKTKSGGLCDDVAAAFSDIILTHIAIDDMDTELGGYTEHAWIVAYTKSESYVVDVPFWKYEFGSGGNWKKLPNVQFTENDIIIFPTDELMVKTAAANPLVMYHGTSEPFTKVDMSKGAQGVFWLTSDPNSLKSGERGASSTKVILRCLVIIKNPAGWEEYEKKSIGELKRDGFDGVILPDPDGSFDAIVFKPSQVKIVGEEKIASGSVEVSPEGRFKNFTLSLEERTLANKPTVTISAYTMGEEIYVGHVTFVKRDDGKLEPVNLEVSYNYRRQGLATAMYMFAEQKTGCKIAPAVEQTSNGRRLWNQLNRPFGNKKEAKQLKDIEGNRDLFSTIVKEQGLTVETDPKGIRSAVLRQPLILHHATPKKNLLEIEKNGLQPRSDDGCYPIGRKLFLGLEDTCSQYLGGLENIKNSVVLEVTLPTGTRIYDNDFEADEVFIQTAIPPTGIRKTAARGEAWRGHADQSESEESKRAWYLEMLRKLISEAKNTLRDEADPLEQKRLTEAIKTYETLRENMGTQGILSPFKSALLKSAADLWHGGRIYGPIQIQAPTKGRYEAGPGLYLTTSYSRASSYAKGGGSTFLVSLKDGLNFANKVEIPLNEGAEFATRYLGKGKLIAKDLKANCERMKKNTFTADILINLTVNYEAGSGKRGMYLLNFLVEHGVDAAIEEQGNGEQWVVVFNPKVVTKVRKIPAAEVTPEMWHLPKIAAMTPEQMLQSAKFWESACFSHGEPGRVPAESLNWREETFDLNKLKGWAQGDWDWLYEDERERDIENFETLEGAEKFVKEMCEAIKDGTIEEIVVAQGTDKNFYVWDGNHRVGIAHVIGVNTLPALVGYQKPKKTASKKKLSILYLDDCRVPDDPEVIHVHNYQEFVQYLSTHEMPDLISFDHDIDLEHAPTEEQAQKRDDEWRVPYEDYTKPTGVDCAKWLVSHNMPVKAWQVHSANPVGGDNIWEVMKAKWPRGEVFYNIPHHNDEKNVYGDKVRNGMRVAAVRRVFHGTPVAFENYDSHCGVYYFTDDTEYADWFANTRHGIHTGVTQIYDLDLKNPFDARKVKNLTFQEYAQLLGIEEKDLLWEARWYETGKKRPFWYWFNKIRMTSKEAFQAQGYDGVIQKERTAVYGAEAKANSYVAFSPGQFKKTAAEEFNLDDYLSKVTYENDIYDAHGNETYGTVRCKGPNGQTVGYIDYSLYTDYDIHTESGEPAEVIHIKMIETHPEARHRGIATKMLQKLKADCPGYLLNWGGLTPAGSAFREEFEKNVTAAMHWYYHISPTINRASILEHGLRAQIQEFIDINRPAGVYVFKTEQNAINFAHNTWWNFSGAERGLDLWKVKIESTVLKVDDHPEVKDAYYTSDSVPVANLKLESYLTEDGGEFDPSEEDGHLEEDDIEYLDGDKTASKIAAPRGIYYHGSSIKNLRSILTQGLVPMEKGKNWQDDPDAGFYNPSRESYGGTYVTKNLMTALGAPRDKGEEGREVIVCMELQPNTFYLDEDDINFYISKPLSGNLNDSSYYIGLYYLANTLPDADQTFKESIAEMRDGFVKRTIKSIEFKMNNYSEEGKPLHEGLKAQLAKLLHGEVWDASLNRMAAHAASKASNYDKAHWENTVHPPKKDAQGEWIEEERATFPSVAEAEAQFKTASEKVTRTLRTLATRGNTTNARIPTPIGYSGSNHITAVAEVRDGTKYRETEAGGFAKPSHIIVHYGTLPQNFLDQYKERVGDRFVVTKPGEEPPPMPEEPDKAPEMPDPNNMEFAGGVPEGWKLSTKKETPPLAGSSEALLP